MANVGVHGVDFVVCNTDAQALEHSPVKNKIQLGASLTEGLGAGADPEIGRQAAEESIAQIQKILETGTKMCFVTAGMGGGTGTGAAPIIAKASRDMGILTVGIVTAPFSFEGKNRAEQAENGIRAMREAVDSLIVINNDKLRQVYGDLGFRNAFSKADEVLAGAAKGIAEVITNHYTANIDLRDAKTVLENSGSALFGTGKGEGAQRAMNAVQEALDSPLLNDNHIKGAKNVLLLVTSGAGENEVTIDEIGEITDHIQREAGGNANIIMGIGGEEEEGTNITCTIIATGFPTGTRVLPTDKPEMVVHELTVDNSTEVVMPTEPEKIIMTLEDEDEDEMPIAEAQQAPIIEDIMEEDVVEEAVEEVIAESVDPEVLYMEEEEFLGFPKLASDEDFEAAMETSMNDLEDGEVATTHVLEWDIDEEELDEEETVLTLEEESSEDAEDAETTMANDVAMEEAIEQAPVQRPAPVQMTGNTLDLFAGFEAAEPEAEEMTLNFVDEDEADEVEMVSAAPITGDAAFEVPAQMIEEDHHGMIGRKSMGSDLPEELDTPLNSGDVNAVNEGESTVFTLDDIEGDGFSLDILADEPLQTVHQEVVVTEVEHDPFEMSLSDFPELKKKNEKQSIEQAFTVGTPEFGLDNTTAAVETLEKDPDLNFELSVEEKVELAPEKEAPVDFDMDRPLAEMPRKSLSDMPKKMQERMNRLQNFQYQFKVNQQNLADAERIPAYMRQGMEVNARNHSSEQPSNLGVDSEGNIRTNNSFLHDNVD
jgi:cell division protein FtsZ